MRAQQEEKIKKLVAVFLQGVGTGAIIIYLLELFT